MRDILFHGKKTSDGTWVDGFYASYEDNEDSHTYIMGAIPDGTQYFPTYEVDPATVGQYTGLMDKNGKRIFEGDILDENGYRFLVVFDPKWAKFKLQHDNKAIQYPEWNRGVQMEIVGNIHDNPEYLEPAP